VQRAVNRLQPVEMVARVYRQARELGFRSINFDLIYGFAQADAQDVRGDARRGDRHAAGSFGGVRLCAHAAGIQGAATDCAGRAPDPALRLSLLQLAVEKLCGAGYVYIGMDHFALPTDSLARRIRTAPCTEASRAIPLMRIVTS